jgi:hypothetical protein
LRAHLLAGLGGLDRFSANGAGTWLSNLQLKQLVEENQATRRELQLEVCPIRSVVGCPSLLCSVFTSGGHRWTRWPKRWSAKRAGVQAPRCAWSSRHRHRNERRWSHCMVGQG